jgi:hypothetical protein
VDGGGDDVWLLGLARRAVPALACGDAATTALVIASHHDGEGPSLQQKMFDVMLTWLVLVPVAYAVGVGVAKARDMWRSR